VIGCDVAPQMLGHAAAADPGTAVNWVQLDPCWRTLPFGSASVDAVVAASVLEYLQQPSAALGECARVLRPGGVMVCTVPNLAHPVRWVEWLACRIALTSSDHAALSISPRLGQYLTYLQVSRQRRPASWWYAVAEQAGLLPLANSAERSPLRLLAFYRPEISRECQ
jgi:ubiquinone/menaquinone biosynthesis C-methylase UbiE